MTLEQLASFGFGFVVGAFSMILFLTSIFGRNRTR